MRIRQEPEKAEFTDTTEGYCVLVYALKPFGCYWMVNVPVGSERDPDIHIRQVDHRS